ncbi:hypothetical protein B0H14DRAFT_2581798 [Mycena olivaceomarginata]|nr:hypothetical protein B0H14DRAFT_2581798 [Mycena olivaceomarginata]
MGHSQGELSETGARRLCAIAIDEWIRAKLELGDAGLAEGAEAQMQRAFTGEAQFAGGGERPRGARCKLRRRRRRARPYPRRRRAPAFKERRVGDMWRYRWRRQVRNKPAQFWSGKPEPSLNGCTRDTVPPARPHSARRARPEALLQPAAAGAHRLSLAVPPEPRPRPRRGQEPPRRAARQLPAVRADAAAGAVFRILYARDRDGEATQPAVPVPYIYRPQLQPPFAPQYFSGYEWVSAAGEPALASRHMNRTKDDSGKESGERNALTTITQTTEQWYLWMGKKHPAVQRARNSYWLRAKSKVSMTSAEGMAYRAFSVIDSWNLRARKDGGEPSEGLPVEDEAWKKVGICWTKYSEPQVANTAGGLQGNTTSRQKRSDKWTNDLLVGENVNVRKRGDVMDSGACGRHVSVCTPVLVCDRHQGLTQTAMSVTARRRFLMFIDNTICFILKPGQGFCWIST